MENVYKRVVKLRNILFGISIVAAMVMCYIAMFHILNGKVLISSNPKFGLILSVGSFILFSVCLILKNFLLDRQISDENAEIIRKDKNYEVLKQVLKNIVNKEEDLTYRVFIRAYNIAFNKKNNKVIKGLFEDLKK